MWVTSLSTPVVVQARNKVANRSSGSKAALADVLPNRHRPEHANRLQDGLDSCFCIPSLLSTVYPGLMRFRSGRSY